MRQKKNFLPIIILILSLFISDKINAKTCCTRHVMVDIFAPAVEAILAMAMGVSLFSSEGRSSWPQYAALIVGFSGGKGGKMFTRNEDFL